MCQRIICCTKLTINDFGWFLRSERYYQNEEYVFLNHKPTLHFINFCWIWAMFVFLNAKNTYNYEIKLSAKKDPLGLFAEAIFLMFFLCLNRLEKERVVHALNMKQDYWLHSIALNNYESLLIIHRIEGNRIIIRRTSLIRFH